MSTRKLLLGLASVLLVAGGITASTASAASPTDTVACAVVGQVDVGPGPGLVTGTADTFSFTSTTITCENPVSPFNGSYNIEASGSAGSVTGDASGETCAAGAGSGTFTKGVTGSFTFTRVGTHVTVTGTISNGTASGKFVAALEFVPTAGPCLAGVGGAGTQAKLAGTAAVETAA